MHELVRQDDAEGFCALDQPHQLGRRLPERGIFEEQLRGQRPYVVNSSTWASPLTFEAAQEYCPARYQAILQHLCSS